MTTECNTKNVSEMTDEEITKAINNCVEHLNSLTEEEGKRKNKRVDAARKQYEVAIENYRKVAGESGMPIIHRTLFDF